MKIKLILSANPNDPLKNRDPFMPLSLPMLAGAAPEHEYEMIDMLRDSAEINFDNPVDLVGISVRLSAQETAFQIAAEFRKRNIKVILGGPQVSAIPFKAIEHADSVVVGEGETLWPIILQDLQRNELKEFYVCSPGTFDARGRPFYQLDELPDLKGIPKPNRSLFKTKYTFDMVFASRGCPIDCDFCTVTKIFGSNYRMRPVEEVMREIAGFTRYYYLLDDTVFGRPSTYDYYMDLYDRISKLKKRNFWTGQANLDAATTKKGQEVIRKAVEAGFLYAAVGIESINDKVLRKNRSISKMGVRDSHDVISRMKESIAFMQDQGIIISGWFTIGYEEDDIETYYRTYEFCEETNIIPVFTPVHALPGSRLYQRLEMENKLQDHQTNITNVSHPRMTNQEIMKAMEYVVNKGYSFDQIIQRTRFYMNKFSRENFNSPGDKFHKTIFTYVTQSKMKKITQGENMKLKRKIQH
jgi:radical SAM superfamily enzyme YgiQ (UPF0313 family)